MLADVADGLDAIELGCGTAYVSAWLPGAARGRSASTTPRRSSRPPGGCRGARPRVPADARQRRGVPFPDASFDFAISEYGASIWCDPYRWIPEAARLLRPGGRLVFLVNSVLVMLCSPDDEEEPAGERLLRPLVRHAPLRVARRRLGRVPPAARRDDRAAADSGFEIEGLTEVQPPADATTRYPRRLDWARRWPCEEIWRARKAR